MTCGDLTYARAVDAISYICLKMFLFEEKNVLPQAEKKFISLQYKNMSQKSLVGLIIQLHHLPETNCNCEFEKKN